MTIDLNALRKLAEDADYDFGDEWPSSDFFVDDCPLTRPWANFIAASKPSTILELIALAEQVSAPAIPVGWALVPVEPTVEMRHAGVKTACDLIYKAMLAAAPSPAKGVQEPAQAQPVADDRFYMDHGLWHDRVTGQHMWSQDQYDEHYRDGLAVGRENAEIAAQTAAPSAQGKDSDEFIMREGCKYVCKAGKLCSKCGHYHGATPSAQAAMPDDKALTDQQYRDWNKLANLAGFSSITTAMETLAAMPGKVVEQVAQHRYIDESDAVESASAWLHEVGGDRPVTVMQDSYQAQAPKMKWLAIFDFDDKLTHAALLTRDSLNWTQLTLISATPSMIRAVQLHSEMGAHIASNWAGAYDCFNEFWRVAMKAYRKEKQQTDTSGLPG
jgi:hypothetical protein